MNLRRLLPFVVALLALALALGNLAGAGLGGNLLVNSFWLLYLADLLPFFALLAFVLLILLVASLSGMMSKGLGFGMAKKLKTKRKKHLALRILVAMYAWAIAITYLSMHCNGFSCNAPNSPGALQLEKLIVGTRPSPTLPVIGGIISTIDNVVPFGLFFPLFLGLLVVCSFVIVRSFSAAIKETALQKREEALVISKEGLEAIREANAILTSQIASDPRNRIIGCYHRLIETGARLGASFTADQTARELERSMRRAFLLDGRAIAGLTALFEEARYSAHYITERDAFNAQTFLAEIAQELSKSESHQGVLSRVDEPT